MRKLASPPLVRYARISVESALGRCRLQSIISVDYSRRRLEGNYRKPSSCNPAIYRLECLFGSLFTKYPCLRMCSVGAFWQGYHAQPRTNGQCRRNFNNDECSVCKITLKCNEHDLFSGC